jgi:hypothetical protein
VWARSENFQPAVVADYASKLKAAGFPLPMLAEEIGWTPQRVAQLRAEQASDAFLAAARAPQAPGGRPETAPRTASARPTAPRPPETP